jgi:hypothetical protein
VYESTSNRISAANDITSILWLCAFYIKSGERNSD